MSKTLNKSLRFLEKNLRNRKFRKFYCQEKNPTRLIRLHLIEISHYDVLIQSVKLLKTSAITLVIQKTRAQDSTS